MVEAWGSLQSSRLVARAEESAHRWRWLAAIVACVCLSVLPAHGARAQNAQATAMARALFEEGVALADQAKWAEAVDRFQRAQSLKPTPAIAFNLASALAETGKIIESSELLATLAHDPTTPPALKLECEAKLAEVSARRAFIVVQVEHAPGDATVEVDGHMWPRAAWGVASPVDPGNHLVIGRTGTVEATRAELTLAAGERRNLALSWPQPEAKGPTREAEDQPMQKAPAEHPRDDTRRPLYKNWVLWTCVGAVVAGGVVAGVLLADKEDKTEAPIPGNAGVVIWRQ
jgi:hypothetical protein